MNTRCTISRHLLRHAASLFALAALVTTVAGCGGATSGYPPLNEVAGVVTLDGQPLADADVTFQPEESGRTVAGTTDSQGRYELIYLNDVRGAPAGTYRVIITTAKSPTDDDGSQPTPETLPARYHSNSELKAEVKKGKNTFDFDLESN